MGTYLCVCRLTEEMYHSPGWSALRSLAAQRRRNRVGQIKVESPPSFGLGRSGGVILTVRHANGGEDTVFGVQLIILQEPRTLRCVMYCIMHAGSFKWRAPRQVTFSPSNEHAS